MFAKYLVSLVVWFSLVFVCALAILLLKFNGEHTYQKGDRLKTAWGKISIIMMNAQVLASIPIVFDASIWPDVFVHFTLPLRLSVNVDLIRVVSFNSCFFSLPLIHRLVLHMMLPAIYSMGIGVAGVAARLCRKKSAKRLNWKYKSLKMLTFGILLMYPSCTQIILSAFNCRSAVHEQTKTVILRVMASNPEVVCFESAEHYSAVILSVIFLCLYVIGLPAMIFIGMKTNRAHLFNVESPKHNLVRSALGTLYLPYERGFYWFELVNMAEKMMMSGGIALLPGPKLQILLGIFVGLWHLLLTTRLAPYSRDSDDWSAFLSGLSIVITMLFGSVLVRDEAQSATSNYEQAIGIMLVIMNSLCLIGQLFLLIFWDVIPIYRQRGATENTTLVTPATTAAKQDTKSPRGVETSSETREQLSSISSWQ
jgi:hypothetical protein